MTERWEELGGRRPEHVDPPPARRKPVPVPFCTTECRQRHGWVEDQDGHPIRRCKCRESSN